MGRARRRTEAAGAEDGHALLDAPPLGVPFAPQAIVDCVAVKAGEDDAQHVRPRALIPAVIRDPSGLGSCRVGLRVRP